MQCNYQITRLLDYPILRRLVSRDPDVLVQLQLQAGGQAIREHPFRQRLRIEDAVHGRHQNGGGARRQIVPRDHLARELVVGPILDDELDLVVRRKRARLSQSFLPASPLPGHLTSTILQTAGGTRVIGRWPPVSSITRPAARQQRLHQRIDIVLQQRFAAGDLDERTAVPVDLGDHLVHGILRPSWNAYAVSHQVQRRSHAVRRTKTHGRPARVDSP